MLKEYQLQLFFLLHCLKPKLPSGEGNQGLNIVYAGEALWKRWKTAIGSWLSPYKQNISFNRRMCMLGLCVLLYSSLWLSYLYFNAEMTDSSGESIKFRDGKLAYRLIKKIFNCNDWGNKGVANFLTSPLWTDFKRTFHTLISSLWHRGWQETWKQFMDDLDPFGEHQALKVSLFWYITRHLYY